MDSKLANEGRIPKTEHNSPLMHDVPEESGNIHRVWGQLMPAVNRSFKPLALFENVTTITHLENGRLLNDPHRPKKFTIIRDQKGKETSILNYACKALYRNGTQLARHNMKEIHRGDHLLIHITEDESISALFILVDEKANRVQPQPMKLMKRVSDEKRMEIQQGEYHKKQGKLYECVACFNQFEEDPAKLKQCQHRFCAKCLEGMKEKPSKFDCIHCIRDTRQLKYQYMRQEKKAADPKVEMKDSIRKTPQATPVRSIKKQEVLEKPNKSQNNKPGGGKRAWLLKPKVSEESKGEHQIEKQEISLEKRPASPFNLEESDSVEVYEEPLPPANQGIFGKVTGWLAMIAGAFRRGRE